MKVRFWQIIVCAAFVIGSYAFAFAKPTNLFVIVTIEGTKYHEHLSVAVDTTALQNLNSIVCNGEIAGVNKKYPISVIFYGGKSSGRGFVIAMLGYKDDDWSQLLGDLPVPQGRDAGISMVAHSPVGYSADIMTFFSKDARDQMISYFKAVYKSKDLVCKPRS